MKVVATNGSDVRNVKLGHWWPGRACTLPSVPLGAFRAACREGTRYMTIASTDLGGMELCAWSRCCPNDQPRRDVGRFIALLRLARTLKPLGYRLEKLA